MLDARSGRSSVDAVGMQVLYQCSEGFTWPEVRARGCCTVYFGSWHHAGYTGVFTPVP